MGPRIDRSFALLPGGASHYSNVPGDFLPALSRYTEDDQFVTVDDDFYSSDFYADTLLRYFRERTDYEQPFFAYLPFQAPHWPLQAPAETIAKYRGRYDDGPDALREARLAALKRLGPVPARRRWHIPSSQTGNRSGPRRAPTSRPCRPAAWRSTPPWST